MRSVKLACVLALCASTAVFAATSITYTLEVGGSNNDAQWEAGQIPAYTNGTQGDAHVEGSGTLSWAASVAVGGTADADPGLGLAPNGAANLVFDLELHAGTAGEIDVAGGTTLVQVGHATVVGGAPTTDGFWSSINDGDAEGVRGDGGTNFDELHNAAYVLKAFEVDGVTSSTGRLIDARADGGPNMDYNWYPSAAGLPAGNTAALGKCVGMGAGYTNIDFGEFGGLLNYALGVGIATDVQLPDLDCGYGIGNGVMFEGQIEVGGLDSGMYTLVLVPGAGNNVAHGAISCFFGDYGTFGSFAAAAEDVTGDMITFEVENVASTAVVDRHVFYNNSFFDGFDPAANAADDGAIAPDKDALLSGGTATFANYISYNKGINGIMVDIDAISGTASAANFAFEVGNPPLVAFGAEPAPAAASVTQRDIGGGVTRVTVLFADNAMPNSRWLKVTVSGLGLPAADVHYWGLAIGETGNNPANAEVDILDENGARNNPKFFLDPAAIDFPYDFTRERDVDIIDENIARNNGTFFLTALQLMTAP